MTDQKYLTGSSSVVPVKTPEMNGLRNSFPPQSSLGYKEMYVIHNMMCLSY